MIRKYKPEDLSMIMDIGNRAWSKIYKMFREAYGDELFQIIVPNETTSKGEQIRTHCEEHPEWVFICEENECIVGFVAFTKAYEKAGFNICHEDIDYYMKL